MKIFNPSSRFELILAADKASGNPTRFACRRLTREEFLEYGARSPFTLEQAMAAARIANLTKSEKRAPKKDEVKIMQAMEPQTFEDIKRAVAASAYVFECACTGIVNLVDEEGALIEMTPAQFAAICPAPELSELANEIVSRSTLDEESRKN